VFTRFVPVVVYGAKADVLPQTLEPGDLVTVRGELGWRAAPATKGTLKPVGRLIVIGWEVERLAGATAPAPVGERLP
jgi:single-stranded DNA-binding protein